MGLSPKELIEVIPSGHADVVQLCAALSATILICKDPEVRKALFGILDVIMSQDFKGKETLEGLLSQALGFTMANTDNKVH